jgi:hypothetical protein
VCKTDLVGNRQHQTIVARNKGIMATNKAVSNNGEVFATRKRFSDAGVQPEIWGLKVYETGTTPTPNGMVIVTNKYGIQETMVLGDKVNGSEVPANPYKGEMGYSLWTFHNPKAKK